MKNSLEFLEWDTLFFGFSIGRIKAHGLDNEILNTLLQEASEQQLRCIYLSAAPDDYEAIRAADDAGFRLVDIRLVLECPLDGRALPAPRCPAPAHVVLREPCSDDREILDEIAVEIGHSSRFRFDRSFPPDACPRLYREWLHKLLVDPHAKTYTACSDGKPTGLIACSRKGKEIGTIKLAGVASQMRGNGIGTALVQEALKWFKSRGLKKAAVVTQGRNVPAQRLYQQMGFFTRDITLSYHKWLPET